MSLQDDYRYQYGDAPMPPDQPPSDAIYGGTTSSGGSSIGSIASGIGGAVGSALGGPVGGMIGSSALGAMGEAFGGGSSSAQDELARAQADALRNQTAAKQKGEYPSDVLSQRIKMDQLLAAYGPAAMPMRLGNALLLAAQYLPWLKEGFGQAKQQWNQAGENYDLYQGGGGNSGRGWEEIKKRFGIKPNQMANLLGRGG